MMGNSGEPYSDKVLELAYEPIHVGELEDPDGFGYVKGSCGDEMRIYLELEGGKIKEAVFLSNGCGATLACGSAVTELAKSRTPHEASKIHTQQVVRYLGGLPSSHLHRAVLAVQALQKALESLEQRTHARMKTGKKS